MDRSIRPALALVFATLFLSACANTPAATTSSAPATVPATVTPAPSPTPCTTQTVLTAPAQASLPVGPTPPRTVLPAVAANITTVPINRIPIPPIAGKTASIDIMEIDQASHLLYVTDRTDNGLDIFDVSSPCAKYVKTIDLGSGTNGVVVAKNVNKVFVTTNDSFVAIIDISAPGSEKVLTKVSTGGKGRADELDYDPKDKKVYAANSDDGIVSVLDGHPATLAWLGGVYGHRTKTLGVEHFGQTGSLAELHRHYGLDANTIMHAAQAVAPGRPVRHLRALP